MARRNARGMGSIFFQKSKGLWVSKITLPDGSTKFQYGKTQKEVKDKHQNALNQLRQGMLSKDDNITVSDFMANYMEVVGKNTLRPTSQESYWSKIRNHINPTIGKIKLKDLRPDHIQSLYSQKLSQGLSRHSVQLLHTNIRTALKQAVRWGLVPRNVTDMVQAPRPLKPTYLFFSKEQLNTFLSAVKGDKWELVFILLIYGGFREGEVLGIMVEDCDMVNRVVNVRHTITTLKTGVVVSEPKTQSSKRAVSLPKFAYDALKVHLDQLNRNSGLIFTSSAGTPIYPRNFIRHFKSILAKTGLPNIRVHDLRHYHASMLLASGVNPKLVQERLGHSTIALTMDIYSHVIPSMQDEVARKIDELMI